MNMSIALNQPWSHLFTLQILLAMTLISSNMGSVCANADTPEIPTVSDNENEFMDNDNDFAHHFDRREAYFNDDMLENREVVPVLAYFANPAISYEDADMDDENILNAKKRNAAAYMNKASSSWVKRQPNWNNLKGMWGKRASQRTNNKSWDKLAPSWGRRSAQFPETN